MRMGAVVETRPDGRPPLTVRGARLRGIDISLEIPSAQVKSAIMLAGLQAEGAHDGREPAPTRDHTERALGAFGARLERAGTAVALDGGQALQAGPHRVAGDISSAAVSRGRGSRSARLADYVRRGRPQPARTALARRAASRRRLGRHGVEREESGEPVGRLTIAHRRLEPVTIDPTEVPLLIDELPALAALGAFGGAVELPARVSSGTRERPNRGARGRTARARDAGGGTRGRLRDRAVASDWRRGGCGGRSPPRHDVRGRGAGRPRAVAHRRRGRRRRVVPWLFRGVARRLRVKTDKLYLVGFMAAGKTSVARALGRGWGGASRTWTS